MSQLENKKSPLELRNELHKMVIADLLGPAGGEDEIVDEPTVRSRYVVGLLAPKGQTAVSRPDDDEESIAQESGDKALSEADDGELAISGTDTQDGKPASRPSALPAMLPSSLGLTFSVSAQAKTIQVTARWGQYQQILSDVLKNDKGEPKRVWKRQQIEAAHELPLKLGKIEPWSPSPEFPEVQVNGLMRKYDSTWTVSLFLVNGQQEPKTRKDTAWVFQPELIVRGAEGESIFTPRKLDVQVNEEPETKSMNMIYRRQAEFAVGHGTGVHAEKHADEWERAYEIRTAVIPAYEVEQVDAPTAREIPALANVQLDMLELSKLDGAGLVAALMPLADAYEAWVVGQETRLASPTPDLAAYRYPAESSLETCRTTLERIRDGINLLAADEKAAEAFRFANLAMAQQRVRTIYTREIRQEKKVALADLDLPKNRSWRPFQLAFMLLNIPALVDPTHTDRVNPTFAKADLLWFPTGGGKTEAYLGVAAFTMGLRRLQGDMDGYSGAAGVTVIMRYTLRLLTLQQFQRATALICAMELIRRNDTDKKWGEEPFRIGLWVGQKSTPNWTEDAAQAIKQNHGQWMGLGSKGTPLQLTNCPWCGKPIGANDVKVEPYKTGRARTFQYCSDPMGTCPFSKKQSPDEGLPIVVVDEEIYRRLPTLLIATVDKFAQMPWKGETQMLFGKVNGYCPRHGWRSPEVEDNDRHNALPSNPAKFPAVKTQSSNPLRPPDLIIQDELHLISGPLGTLVGLYETAVDRLCTWDYKGVRVRPKVIASTATIRQANKQVHNLFLREVQIFPPSGLDAGDNFFSLRRPASESPGRLYLGVCAPGTRMKTLLIRVYVAYLAAAQKLYEENGKLADPWMSLIGYFNSMRELGGMRRVAEDAVRTRLRSMDDRGLVKRFIESDAIEELTSRKSATDIPRILDRLEAIFDPANKGRVHQHPYDVVLATNMISVGVDVNRLGLMVVASQPKATSEYIQATSRVGRAFPGVVCTVYNWARPRDLSHYERFEHYHATFYKQVEALSVTPFSPRALDRGLSGVYVSLIRLLGQEFNPNEGAGKFTAWPHDLVSTVEKDISFRARGVVVSERTEELVKRMIKTRRDEWLNKSTSMSGGILTYNKYGTDRAVPLLKQPTEQGETEFFCLNSLRDVEPQIKLLLNDHDMDNRPEPIEDSGTSKGQEA